MTGLGSFHDSTRKSSGSAGDEIAETYEVYSRENYSNQVCSERQRQRCYRQNLMNRGKAGYSKAGECDNN